MCSKLLRHDDTGARVRCRDHGSVKQLDEDRGAALVVEREQSADERMAVDRDARLLTRCQELAEISAIDALADIVELAGVDRLADQLYHLGIDQRRRRVDVAALHDEL